MGSPLLRLRLRIPLGHECLSVVSVVCCQVQVSSSGSSLVQRIATDCGVSEEDREAWAMRKPLLTRRWFDVRKKFRFVEIVWPNILL